VVAAAVAAGNVNCWLATEVVGAGPPDPRADGVFNIPRLMFVRTGVEVEDFKAGARFLK